MAIRCMVVDDEPLAMQLICDYIVKTPSLQLVHFTTSPVEALQFINTGEIDLVFLDIQMPELTGINFLKLVQNKCKTILITAYQDYAIEGYEHNVIDYLLKPVTLERFLLSVQKAEERLNTQITKDDTDFIFVKTEYKIQKINFAEILYLEGLRDYAAIHTVNGKILSLQPMRLFEEKLPQHLFIRIHRSYIVSIGKINYIEKNRVVINNHFLPIGDTYKEALLKKISAV
jgi:two-component system, LytTR family, response regulator